MPKKKKSLVSKNKNHIKLKIFFETSKPSEVMTIYNKQYLQTSKHKKFIKDIKQLLSFL